MKKIVCFMISVLMVLSLIPVTALAMESEDVLELIKERNLLAPVIAEADKEIEETRISEDGTDVPRDTWWVDENTLNTLKDAREKANTVYYGDSVDAIKQQQTILSVAIDTFEKAKKHGTQEDEPVVDLSGIKEKIRAALYKAQDELDGVKISTDGKDISYEEYWVKQEDKDSLLEAIRDAKVALNDENATAESLESTLGLLRARTGLFVARKQYGKKDSSTPDVNPNPDVNPAPQGYVTLTIYRNMGPNDYEFTTKSYSKGTYLYNVWPYSRAGYRPDGYSYTPGGSLINRSLRVEDLAYTTLYANWSYVGDRYYGYGYHRPNSLKNLMNTANAFKKDYQFQIANASPASKAEFDAAYKAVEEMYDNSYWGYYYGYYNDGRVYYRNGNWYTYNEYLNRFGSYDMESYRRYGRYDGYYDGYYDKYYNGYYHDIYERNGRLYSYNEYYNVFGRYPYQSERVYDRYGYWDAYYGWGGYGYGYYGADYKAKLERLVDAIRAIARQYDGPIYYNYANLDYPSYANDYYYGYDYYYYNNNSKSEMRNLITKAEELIKTIRRTAPYSTVMNLQSCIDEAYRALQGRSNYSKAYENLKQAIATSDQTDKSIYIRRGYMTGGPNGTFGPNDTLTRAQVAQIVANLLEQSGKVTVYNPKQYSDVENFRWYKHAVDLVTSYGIMTGTPGGKFDPNGLVTKAELVVIAARLNNHPTSPGNVFGLTSHYWAQGYIQTAVKKGWIDVKKGFIPGAPITRAEAVHIFNGALNFTPDQDYIIKYANEMKKFTDVGRGTDYYYDIIAATNTISFSNVDGGTRWLAHLHPAGMWSMKQYSNGINVAPIQNN